MPFSGVKNWIRVVRDYLMRVFFSVDFEVFSNVTKKVLNVLASCLSSE